MEISSISDFLQNKTQEQESERATKDLKEKWWCEQRKGAAEGDVARADVLASYPNRCSSCSKCNGYASSLLFTHNHNTKREIGSDRIGWDGMGGSKRFLRKGRQKQSHRHRRRKHTCTVEALNHWAQRQRWWSTSDILHQIVMLCQVIPSKFAFPFFWRWQVLSPYAASAPMEIQKASQLMWTDMDDVSSF